MEKEQSGLMGLQGCWEHGGEERVVTVWYNFGLTSLYINMVTPIPPSSGHPLKLTTRHKRILSIMSGPQFRERD